MRERPCKATVCVSITYYGVPCRDTTDASRQVLDHMPLREIGLVVDALGCDKARVDVGYVTVYEDWQ